MLLNFFRGESSGGYGRRCFTAFEIAGFEVLQAAQPLFGRIAGAAPAPQPLAFLRRISHAAVADVLQSGPAIAARHGATVRRFLARP